MLWCCELVAASITPMSIRGLARNVRRQDGQMPVGPVVVALPGRYGEDRIAAGARFLDHLDPGWWQEGAWLPADLTALDMANPYRCVLAWWAAWHLPAPPRRGTRRVPPYDRAMLVLGLSSQQAQALGFTGADADLLTPGWRHLITCLRADDNRRAGAAPARSAWSWSVGTRSRWTVLVPGYLGLLAGGSASFHADPPLYPSALTAALTILNRLLRKRRPQSSLRAWKNA